MIRVTLNRCVARSLIVLFLVTTVSNIRAQNSSQTVDKGVVVDIKGNVELKRRGQSSPLGRSPYSRVSLGVAFFRGDLLKVTNSASAKVRCPEGDVHELKVGIHGLPCKAATQPRTAKIDDISVVVRPTRSGEINPNVPIILSPRKTKLLNPRPMLRWIPSQRPVKYTVNVYEANPDGSKRAGAKLDWRVESQSNHECPYPTDADKQLTPGVTYMLTVLAGNYSSDEESIPRLVFSLMTSQESQLVKSSYQEIVDMNLPKVASGLLTARLYARMGLTAEAIDLLREISVASDEPAIPQLMGDLYSIIQLNTLALESYLKAHKFSEIRKDLLSAVQAQTSLGQIYEALGNKEQAVEFWRLARNNRQLLEETETVQEIDKTLERLQKQ